MNNFTIPNVATVNKVYFEHETKVTIAQGFKANFFMFDGDTFRNETGNREGTYTIPAGTSVCINIGRTSATYDGSEFADIKEFASKVTFESNIFSIIGSPEYLYDGEMLNFKRNGFDVLKLFGLASIPADAETMQAFAIYGGVIFQLYNANKINLINYLDGTVLTTLDITSGHGDCIDISNEFYDENDEFPLAYITAETTPAKVYVNRITRTETALIRTYRFDDIAKTGYFPGHCANFDKNILYLVGYSENSYYLDEQGTNRMIVSKWDLSNCITNQDGTLTPAFISSFTTPFIKTAQGQKFFRNRLYILSSHWGADQEHDTKIVVIDPYKERIVTIMNSFPTGIKQCECEGLDFVLNEENTQYDMVVSGNAYYKLTFNS